MCGILAWINQNSAVDADRLVRSLMLQRHRGPDRQRIFLWDGLKPFHLADASEWPPGLNLRRYKVGMGHNRLSIIDLSDASNQPFVSQDGRYALVYNGEIYNFLELREELEAEGEIFYTKGDAEILMKCLVKYGVSCVKRLNGMWAFCFFDIENQKIIMSRDRYGKKPLYYYHSEGDFIAASEFKALFNILGKRRREMNFDYLSAFIFLSAWPVNDDGSTLYKSVYALGAGCSLIYDIQKGSFEIIKNNSIENFINAPFRIEDLPADLESAVKIRLRSDVPVGVLLSGGVDSTIVSAYACAERQCKNRIGWYTAITANSRDPLYARIAADSLGIKLREIEIPDSREVLDAVEKMTRHYEIPLNLSSASCVAANFMFQAMANDGIKVVLDGTGGDEIFGGYLQYRLPMVNSLLYKGRITELIKFIYYWDKYGGLPKKHLARHFFDVIMKKMFGVESGLHKKHYLRGIFLKYLNDVSDYKLFDNVKNSKFRLNTCHTLFEAQLYDVREGKLPLWLYMNDQNSMMHSLEVRSPFLDYRLAKYLQMPEALKFNAGYNKYILRQSVPAFIDKRIKWRPDKQGFRWGKASFLNKNKHEIKTRVNSSVILRKFFNLDKIVKDFELSSGGGAGHLDKVILAFYSVAVLESVYNCAVSD